MQEKILRAFLYNDKLKFNEIEKLTDTRSNKLAYHLKNFQERKLLIKNDGGYSLSNNFEHIIPYLSDSKAVLPVVLISVGEGKKFFLHVRDKKPYKGFLGLPAGRILVGEKIDDAVKRIMKNKHSVDAKLKHVNSVSLEHVTKEGKVIHSFLLILISASVKGNVAYTDIGKNRGKIIKSDYWLLKNHQNSRAKIKTIKSNL